MKRITYIAVLLALAASAHAETPTATSAPTLIAEAKAPAACPLEMARDGFECLVGWTDAKGNLVCQRWARTRSMVTGLDKFGAAAPATK